VVLQKRFEVLLAAAREEEGIDTWAKLLECFVGWSEKGATNGGSFLKDLDKAGLAKTEQKSAEF